MQRMGGLPRAGPSSDELRAEATFTLHCLANEGYVRIKETTAQDRLSGGSLGNFEFEFVPEKLNEFIAGL